MKKKILITGANGFIGSFMIEEALKREYDVYAAIRKTSNLDFIKDKNIQLIYINLSNKNELIAQLNKYENFDYIIHNAGITKTCDYQLFNTVNFIYTKNLIDALAESKQEPTKFILISSLAAIGPGDNKNISPIVSSTVPNPISLYGKSKRKAEEYLQNQKKINYLIFRPTGVYGPREKDYFVMYKTVKNGLESYIGTRKQYISFIYVKDLTRVLFDALSSPIINKAYFMSDLKKYNTEEFNRIVKKELNVKTIKIVIPKFIVKIVAFISEHLSCLLKKTPATLNTEKYKEISQKNWLCDSSDLVRDFNFSPNYDLKKGIHETINWYKQQNLL